MKQGPAACPKGGAMECPKCHAENRETRKFCAKCGEKLLILCPQCSSENLPDEQFCGECGHELRKPKEPVAIDYQQPRSYTPKFLADKILTSRSAIEGERKLVTVLFADVAGFTSMSEKLDPEDVHEIMDGCFRILMDEIHRYEGTVNEFRGDGVMALFGAPVSHEDHAQRACHAALAAQKALVPYAERLHREYGIDFKIRIGLNSGPVVVGSIGDDLRMDYTAQGDTANLAARMESNAEPGSVLASKHTYWPTRDFFQFEFLGPLAVKGKEEPVKAYRLLKVGDVETRIEAAAGRGFTRFVGRKRELETLTEAFEQVKSGHGQVVGIVGEAGVGKSRILNEFRNHLPQGQYTYLEGRCLHYGGSMPYLPILDVFRSFAGIKEGDAETAIKSKMQEKIIRLDEDLKRIIPPFQDLLSLKVEDEAYLKLEPGQKKERIFEAIRDLFVRGSQNVPIVLAIEDLHWIDKTTEELSAYLIGAIPTTRIMLILLYRPEYTHAWGSKSYYTKVGVDQLSASTSAELVQAILEGGDVEPELRELILGRTSGNPLFMEELTHSLLENGSIQKRNQQFILAGKLSEIQVPDTIQGIIASRIDRLEETLKRLLQVASVIGREFFFRILQAITGMREDLKTHLLNLQGLEFIYEKTLFPELEYIFKHALTQEVAYNSLLLKRRKEIHERIGQAIEELYPGRLEEFYEMLAYHYVKSGNKVRTLHYLKLSGKKAVQKESLWEAFRFYRDVWEILKQRPDTDANREERMQVFLHMASPMRLLVYPEDSELLLDEAEELAKAIGDRRILASIYGWRALFRTQKGSPLLARPDLERCYEEAIAAGDLELTVQSAFDLCVSFCATGDWRKLINLAPKISNLLEESGNEFEFFGKPAHPYSIFPAFHAIGLTMMGDFHNGARLLDSAFSRVERVGNLYTTGVLEMFRAIWFGLRGDGTNTLIHSLRASKCYEDSQARLYLPLSQITSAYGHYLLGDLKAADMEIKQALELQREIGTRFWVSSNYLYLALVNLDSSNIDRAMLYAEQAISLSQETQAKHLEGRSRVLLGKIIGKIDQARIRDAEDSILHGMKISDQIGARPDSSIGYLYLGELYADRGEKEKALENLQKAESMFQEMGMDYWLGKTQEVLARL